MDNKWDLNRIKGLLEIGCLPPREEKVLGMYFGIDEDRKNLTEIGHNFDVSGTRIAQLKNRALRKLGFTIEEIKEEANERRKQSLSKTLLHNEGYAIYHTKKGFLSDQKLGTSVLKVFKNKSRALEVIKYGGSKRKVVKVQVNIIEE